MASVKTAISIPEALFKQADRLARKMQISRSQFFARAADEFIRRRRGKALLENYNEVYADGPTDEEKQWLEHAKAAAAKFLEPEEW